MLKTPHFHNDPVLNMIAEMNGRPTGPRVIEEGVVEIGSFSLDMMIWGSNAPKGYMGYIPTSETLPATVSAIHLNSSWNSSETS